MTDGGAWGAIARQPINDSEMALVLAGTILAAETTPALDYFKR